MKIKLLACLVFFGMTVRAEDFSLKLGGDELRKIAAIEIELEFEPNKSFSIDEEFSIHNSFEIATVGNGAELCPNSIIEGEKLVLFKTVDQNNSVIRIFLAEALPESELLLHGSLTRVNYSGKPNVVIKSINFIPDFAQTVDSNKISSNLEIKKNSEFLPFMGISKADLLGPNRRVFSENMFVSISNIETYGFTLGKSIRKPRINGKQAKFLTDEIIAVNLSMADQDPSRDLEIVLELDVDGQTISKTVDRIKFVSD